METGKPVDQLVAVGVLDADSLARFDDRRLAQRTSGEILDRVSILLSDVVDIDVHVRRLLSAAKYRSGRLEAFGETGPERSPLQL